MSIDLKYYYKIFITIFINHYYLLLLLLLFNIISITVK